MCRAKCQRRFGATRPRPSFGRYVQLIAVRLYISFLTVSSFFSLPSTSFLLNKTIFYLIFFPSWFIANGVAIAILDGASGNDEEKELVIPLTSSISSNGVNVSSTAGQQINERSCSNEDRGGCEHVCSQSAEPDSIRCLCYRGFRLNADGKSCVGMFTSAPLVFLSSS